MLIAVDLDICSENSEDRTCTDKARVFMELAQLIEKYSFSAQALAITMRFDDTKISRNNIIAVKRFILFPPNAMRQK